MRRKFFAVALCALLFPLSIPAQAQQPKKAPHIGFLSAGSVSEASTRVEGFRQGLGERGYVEGQNIVIEYRYADGKLDQLPRLAAGLVQLKVNVIVTGGMPPTRTAQQATQTIPIVMTVVGDPIEAGLVSSLAKPGGNITGLTQMARQLSGKRLELLKEAFPRISRVAVFVETSVILTALEETRLAAETLGIKLQTVEVRGPNPDFDNAFRTVKSERAGALIFLPGPVLNLHRKRVAELAAKSRLPAIYTNEFVDVGGLLAYGPNHDDLYRRAATYVDKILKGAKPADLPVEQPTKFELVINLKTAKQIGVTIPQSMLYRADRVIR